MVKVDKYSAPMSNFKISYNMKIFLDALKYWSISNEKKFFLLAFLYNEFDFYARENTLFKGYNHARENVLFACALCNIENMFVLFFASKNICVISKMLPQGKI